jgi:hypothetical protein
MTTLPRFQCRLRTLMLFVTLACVIASWVGWRLYIERLDDAVRVEIQSDDPYDHDRMMRDLHPSLSAGRPPLPPKPKPTTWPPPRGLLP